MAFHIACPITCRRICDCELGFPEGLRSARARDEFLAEVARVEEFLRDPWLLRAAGEGRGAATATVQVLVPKVVPPPPPAPEPAPSAARVDDGGGVEEGGGGAVASVLAKRAALQRQAAAASMAAEDYVRRLEAGGAVEVSGDNNIGTEEQNSSIVKVMCRICFSGENEGSDRALKMLSCKFCSKKYHRSCLKVWAEYRDLFHWTSWACPSCRICEVCRRAGDPTKLMYCKRCDGAYHCYCQQPPHKNVSHGPYLCPKHTRCHSCGSTVPGSGLSTRWFLGYTCCDACGRLFVKGKYCPVCLKVYRDSEMTPMVCCDVCQQWVHCVCDGISDEKYQQFQADGNLYYKCPACRGDCYQVKDIDDAVRELWRRRDKADRDLIASLRSAAGLPTKEEIFSICPYSDDEESGPVILKNDHGKPLKFSVKGLADKSSKNSKEYWKNSKKLSNKKLAKKECQLSSVGQLEEPYDDNERQVEARSLESSFGDQKFGDEKSDRTDGQEILSSPLTRSPGTDGVKSNDGRLGSHNDSLNEEAVGNKSNKVPKVYIKGNKQGLHIKEGAGKYSSKSDTVKGTKLVIHLGVKNRNATSSPMSEASSSHKDQDQSNSNGSEGVGLQTTKDSESYMLDAHPLIAKSSDWKGAKVENVTQLESSPHGDREESVIKLRKISDMHKQSRANTTEQNERTNAFRSTRMMRRTRTELDTGLETKAETTGRSDEILPEKLCVGSTINLSGETHNKVELQSVSNSSNDPKPLLKLKFKSPYFEQRNSLAARAVEEKNPIKGQRSKRKRLPAEKLNSLMDENFVQLNQEDPADEVIDANWILQKLGKDAIGKRVEVHEAAENAWRQGVVSNVIEGTSSISVRLDNGRSKTLQLGKQTVRFISQKLKKATKT